MERYTAASETHQSGESFLQIVKTLESRQLELLSAPSTCCFLTNSAIEYVLCSQIQRETEMEVCSPGNSGQAMDGWMDVVTYDVIISDV